MSGSTASDWQGHLSAVKNRNPDLVIILIGGNDLLGSIQDGFISLSDIDQYYTNLTGIVTNLQNNIPIPDIVMMTYFDPFDGFSANLAGSLDYLTNATPTTPAANQVIRNVAIEQNCYLIEGTRSTFLHHGYGGELGDAQHSMSI